MLEETIVAVVADHGGYRNTHGITPPMIAEVYCPLLLKGMIWWVSVVDQCDGSKVVVN